MSGALAVIGRNLAVATTAHVVARLLNLALLAVVARMLGVEGLAGVAVAMAVGTAILFATDLGLAPRLIREASARPEAEQDEYARALAIKLVLAGGVTVVCAVVYLEAPPAAWVVRLCVLMAVAAVIESFTFLHNAVCRAHERFDFEAAGEILEAVVLISLGGGALLAGLPAVYIGLAAIAAAALELALTLALTRRFVRPAIAWPGDTRLLLDALPYAMTSFGLVALMQLDVLVFSLVATRAEVGRYAAVSRLLLGGAYLTLLASGVVVPRATGGYARGSTGFRGAAGEGARLAVLVAGAVAVAVVAFARPALTLIYGAALGPVHPLLRLGAAFLFLSIAGIAPRTVLTAADRQSAYARSVACGLAVTGAAIVLLGGRYGATGAVEALILGEAVAVAVALVAARELWPAAETLPVVTVATSACVLAVAAILWLPTSELTAGAVGIGLYAAAVGVSGEAGRALTFVRTAAQRGSQEST